MFNSLLVPCNYLQFPLPPTDLYFLQPEQGQTNITRSITLSNLLNIFHFEESVQLIGEGNPICKKKPKTMKKVGLQSKLITSQQFNL